MLYEFQSTHPRRVWHFVWPRFQPQNGFNPHTHAGCDNNFPNYAIGIESFNPHTHAGCDKWQTQGNLASVVSIHTPTQGVTRRFPGKYHWITFQSTHPRRVWLCLLWRRFLSLCFNPHTHAGCDFLNQYHFRFGAFQSTHPRRVWHEFGDDPDKNNKFQSTHPRRVWQKMQF